MSLKNNFIEELLKLENSKKAKILSNFFKTKKGEYGEGDIFLGITVPLQRKVAKKFEPLNLEDLQDLILSKIHEFRLTSLLILIEKYKKADKDGKKRIYDFYLKNKININNWDLVDLSAPQILGDYLFKNDKSILYKLAKSKTLWDRRMAILATYIFIKNNKFDDAIKISEILLNDRHALIHKAVGWMLREVGKRDQKTEEEFLNKFSKKMPRTMLRYAIEKFSDEKRNFYLK